MAFDLYSIIRGYFNSEMLEKASSFLGENSSTVQKGLDAVIPASLLGIINKAETGNSASLLTMASSAANSGILGDIAGTFTKGGGGVPAIAPGLLTGLFGDKFGSLANAVSGVSGLKGSTVSSLFGTVVPVALAALGNYAKETGATPGAISTMLSGMKGIVLDKVPTGLNLSSVFDSKPSSTPVKEVQEVKKGFNPLWLLLALAGVALLVWLARGCGDNGGAAPAVSVVHDTLVKTDSVVIVREPSKVILPNGVELDAYKGGIEDLLVAFLNDPEAKPGKDNWFDFNDLNFKFGTAEINPGSQKEVDNLVQILKAYPSAKIKIGGYTDHIGAESANKKLSLDRAQAVYAILKNASLESQLDGAEGYGAEFAKYPPSAPEEDRIKDRRVSVSVRAK